MRYVVTGSDGFIGSHLTAALLEQGHDVDAVDIDADVARWPLDLDGVHGIYHLAGRPGVRSSWADFPAYLDRNLLATQRVFDQAVAAGVRVVYASSSSVYGDTDVYPTPEHIRPQPLSPYGVTKLACEHLAYAYTHQHGLNAVGLRYFTVYGPRQRPDMAFSVMFEALATGARFLMFGDGSARRSFTYVGDAVDATIRVMRHGRAPVYNIGGDYETSMSTAVRVAEQVSGRTLRVEYMKTAAGDVRRTCADISLAREHLGWEPTTVLPEGMAAQWASLPAAVAA